MKIRTGFISNSSTSCFICGSWGRMEHSVEEVKTILQKMLDFYNDLEDKSRSFDNVFKEPRVATKEDVDLLEDWDVPEDQVKDNILIYGADDNAIPWSLFTLIEQKFMAERIHLG